MKRYFQVKLRSDAIMPSHYGTVNFSPGLDYIPGTMFLGVSAARLYGELNQENAALAYLVFHGGAVRFGNGLPLSPAGLPTFPMPLCWHEDKNGLPASDPGLLNPGNILTDPIAAMAKGIQPRPLRTGYLAQDGCLVRPESNYRLKNAMDPDRLRNAHHQVFGSYSLKRGQSFYFSLEADEEAVSEELFERVARSLEGEIRVGRSRSAEYGAALCRPLNLKDPRTQPEPRENPREVLLWLLSDLALQRHAGVPDLLPEPTSLGLPEGRLDLDGSFLGFRRFDLFNAHRRRREQERQVISAGSVLLFRLEREPGMDNLARLQRGLGLFRQYGLGEVWLNPPLLFSAKPMFQPVAEPPKSGTPKAEKPDHPLVHWLERRALQDRADAEHDRTAMLWLEELKRLYDQAKKFQSHERDGVVGPGASQWGRVMVAAQRHRRDPDGLATALFDDERGICHAKDSDWHQTVSAETTGEGRQLASFASWLRGKFPSANPIVVGLFAREAIRWVHELETPRKAVEEAYS